MASRSEGEQLCAAMMTCRKRKPTLDENQVVTELGDTSGDVTGECESLGGGKWQRMDSLRRRTTSTRLDEILTSSEEQHQEHCQNHQESLASQTLSHEIQHDLCNIQRHAVDIQEHTGMALLELLCQTLSPPSV